MYPIITQIGPFTLHTFGVVLAVAILVGSTVLAKETQRLGDPAITDERLQKLIWYIVLAVVGGGRLMHCIVEWDYFSQHPLEIFAVWKGGLVMYGGYLGTFLTVVGFAIKNDIAILRLCDLIAPSAFLGQAIGRWGCFFAGDDYGKPTSAWFGVKFTDPNSLVPPALRGVALHPVQFYMSLKALTISMILFWITRRKKFDGQVTGWCFMLYAVMRSFVELFRGDIDRGFVLGLSTAQFTSVFVFVAGASILLFAPRRMLADDIADLTSRAPSKKGRKPATA